MKMKRKYANLLTILMALLLLSSCADKNETQDLQVDAITIEETQIYVENARIEEEKITQEKQEQEESIPEKEQIEMIVEGNKGTITIGTIGAPYNELLTQAKIMLAKEGWDLQIKEYVDYTQINQDVLNGTIDAHIFAHQTYLDSYNDVNGTALTSVAPVCYEKYGIYSVLNEDLTKMAAEVTIGIPAEDTKKAKALLFLEELGYITLKEGVGLTAILEDIVENPHNIQFVEYTQEMAAEVLNQTQYCVMGADQAILVGLEPHKVVLKEETSWMNSAKSMAALLVTTSENVENEKLLVLMDVLKSETIQKYVNDTYKQAVGLFH